MLTTDEVKHIAKLANLKLSDEEIKKFQTQLSSILEYVKQLDEVNTDGVEPTFQVNDLKNVFQDTSEEFHEKQGISKDDALRNASDAKDGYFTTKAVL